MKYQIYITYFHYLSARVHTLCFFLIIGEMRVREKVGICDYQSGNSQGILIHVLGMNPVFNAIASRCKLHIY